MPSSSAALHCRHTYFTGKRASMQWTRAGANRTAAGQLVLHVIDTALALRRSPATSACLNLASAAARAVEAASARCCSLSTSRCRSWMRLSVVACRTHGDMVHGHW